MSEQSLPEAGDIYRHKGNGKQYVVEFAGGQVEHPDTHEWVPAVRYHCPGEKFGPEYVRTMRRFLERFEFVRRSEQ